MGRTRRKIGDLLDALASICILQADVDQPSWIDGAKDVGNVVVAVRNGLLAVERRRLIAHTPQFFNQTSVPFDYDAKAPSPERWLQFLAEVWPDQAECVDALGEWFGYVVSGRTDLHKILLMVGPTRGGKGAIARVLTALIGRKNVAGPTLNSLGGEFGLAPLIGKPLAVISDARFAGKDASVVVERLLSISGEDTLTVNRKYRDQWTGKLPSRLHVLSNELPKLGDASTAIVGKIVLLLLSHSWLGREDHKLEPDLQNEKELTGILNWSLDGLHRLSISNAFTKVASAKTPSSKCAILRRRWRRSSVSDAQSRSVTKCRSTPSTPNLRLGPRTMGTAKNQSRHLGATCGRRFLPSPWNGPEMRLTAAFAFMSVSGCVPNNVRLTVPWTADHADQRPSGPHGPHENAM